MKDEFAQYTITCIDICVEYLIKNANCPCVLFQYISWHSSNEDVMSACSNMLHLLVDYCRQIFSFKFHKCEYWPGRTCKAAMTVDENAQIGSIIKIKLHKKSRACIQLKLPSVIPVPREHFRKPLFCT